MFLLDNDKDPFRFFKKRSAHFAKFSPSLKDDLNEFLVSFYLYIDTKTRKVWAYLSTIFSNTPIFLDDIKKLFVSRMFWGRGNYYKFLGVIGIGFPLLLSAGFIIVKNNLSSSNTQIASLATEVVTSNANSNQAIESKTIVPNVKSITSKVTDSNAVANKGISDWYKVQTGDTIQSIATKYNISTDILKWSNGISSDSDLKNGQEIYIFPIQGIIYTVKKGDTLASIVSTYKIQEQNVMDRNLMSSDSISEGQTLLLPGATEIAPSPAQGTTTYKSTYINRFVSKPIYNIIGTPFSGSSDGNSWFFSQLDGRWANYVLGGGWSAWSYLNVKNSGCLVTDIAMVAKFYGYNITPETIASNPRNFDGALFNWNSIGGIFNVVPLGGLFGGGVNWKQINSQLDQNHPVIVSIYYDYHYVVLYKRLANGDYLMNDPARGAGLDFQNYFRPSSITQAVAYIPI